MNKVLSVFLSISLIFGSVAPSMAQKQLITAGRAASTFKPILTAQTRAVLRQTVAPIMLPAAFLPNALRASYKVAALPPNATLSRKVTQSVQAQQKTAQTLVDFTKIQLTDKQALETVDNFFGASLSDKPLLLLNGLPHLHIVKSHPITKSQHDQAIQYYRRALKVSLNNTTEKKSRSVILDLWGRKMSAISNLGLYGTEADAKIIILAAQSVPEYLIPCTDIIVARALLSLEAYEVLKEFADVRALNGPLGAHWQPISQYAKKHALALKFPAIAEGKPVAVSDETVKSLKTWNALNAYHADMSVQATENWLELRTHTSYVIEDEAVTAAVKPLETPSLQEPLTISAPVEANLSLGATEIPAVTSAEAADVTAGTAADIALPNLTAQSATPLVKKTEGFLSRFTGRLKTSSANVSAKRILSQTYPLPTLLKQIIESHAADQFKEEAFVRLYEQNMLQDIIATMPEATQQRIKAWYGSKELGKRLLGLYNDGTIFDGVSRITNAKRQESLLQQLDNMVTRPEWAELAKAAYDDTPVVHSTFSGVVPPVPTIDKAEILATFRPAGWADTNRGSGVEKGGEIYFQNQIPFYYRYASGKLSSKPVGLLSQEQANWYGRLLSNLHLATQPGFSIPKGFVLALDEMGQWKFVMPNGNRAIVESNPKSKKLLEEIQENGSKQVAVDTPYSSSDLLAMANLLEHNSDLNLELIMGAPHSLNLFLKVLGSYIGLDSAGALTGPFKATLKDFQGVANMMGNLVSGVGYLSPWAGGAAQGIMTKFGSIRTLQVLFIASILGLGYSLFSLGMTGFQSAEALKSIPLGLMAIPMLTAVFAGSLLGTQMNVFLNYFKDPVARTSAHLGFAETKQWSRLGLVTSTALLSATLDVNWSVVVPIAFILVGLSAALLYNTPVYKAFNSAQTAKKVADANEKTRLASLTPSQLAAETAERQEAALIKKQDKKSFERFYKNIFRTKSEVKDIAFRVRRVYASYAASLMMLGQTSTELLGSSGGQFLVGVFMLATALMRRFASKMVSSNKITDNQLTGMSLPLLAGTAAGLTLVPTDGFWILGFGILGIAHYVATAVPGQLDAARLQNLVSAEMSRRKQAVTDYENLSPAEQTTVQANWDEMDKLVFAKPTTKERLDLLNRIEKSWASKASRDYSYFNGNGLVGILTAAGAGYLFADLGPQWTKDLLDNVGSWLGDKSSLITLNRLVLGYSTSVAMWLAYKNRALTKDFFSLFNKKKITAENLAAGLVTPKDFGLTPETMDRQLVGIRKNLKKVEDELVNYAVNSERKMTKHLQALINVHNRFVAAQQLEREAGQETSSALLADFNHLRNVLKEYQILMQRSDPSIMLQREFDALATALCEDGAALQTLKKTPDYMPEGSYTMPKEYAKYEDAIQLLAELDQLAGQILNGTVSKETYRLFITYQARVNDLFSDYRKANPADSARVLQQLQKLNKIVKGLKDKDATYGILEHNAGTTSPQDIQELRDVLAGYAN